ncbi:protein-glutamate methylesterase/protein-glutamine glutaminase [Algiphilus sp.]|uniref:protein-glutamate methylesterase/protein-glutamine glutaminase n=1 Tax=Algiphilus sp. TaxID=1872431 RepID=UPI003B52C87A
MSTPIRVLLVDDSAAMRALLRELLADTADINVIGEAADAYEARERIKALNPDVITLDVEMPRMNGLRFLENLMRLRPTPVVMVSSLTAKGAQTTLQAFALGAVEVLQKPSGTTNAELAAAKDELVRAIRAASKSRPRMRQAAPVSPNKFAGNIATASKFCLIGASTGGTEAIREVLANWRLPEVAVLIVQHIPPAFSASFAERLDRSSPLFVRHAVDGQALQSGHAYVAPGGLHMRMVRSRGGYGIQLDESPPVNRHRPAVDVLFDSAKTFKHDCVAAVLLTGMGDDGARGMEALHELGVFTIAQDEATSVVWGMPGVAVSLGAADRVVPLQYIAQTVADAARTRSSSSSLAGRYSEKRIST